MRTDKIGINISRLRIERGITQEQLGRDIGLTASAISNIGATDEAGERT